MLKGYLSENYEVIAYKGQYGGVKSLYIKGRHDEVGMNVNEDEIDEVITLLTEGKRLLRG